MWSHLTDARPIKEKPSCFDWILEQDLSFPVRSFYKDAKKLTIEDQGDWLGEGELSIIKDLWQTNVIDKVKLLRWKLIQDKLPSKSQLARRRIIYNSRDVMCVFYHQGEETLTHLLFHCSLSNKKWKTLDGWTCLKYEESSI